MPQLTDDQVASFEKGMLAMESLKSEILPLKGKMDAFDAKKFDDIQKDIQAAMKASEDVKALEAKQADIEAKQALIEKKNEQLEAALNRPVIAVTPEQKQQELKAKGTKLFNDFARVHTDEREVSLQSFVKQTVTDEAELKALTVNSDPNGGYLTMPEFGGIISTYVYETSPLRQLASVITVGTDAYELVTDNDQAGWGWVGETQARPDTYTPVLGKLMIPVNEMYAMPNASQKMLDDAMIDVEAWLAGKVSQVFSRGEASAFISGNGVNKPLGILSYAAGTSVGNQQIRQVPSLSASTFTYGGLLALQNSLKEPYQANAVFLMQRASMVNLLTIADTQNRPIFNMNYDRNAAGEGFVMGKAVRFAADMPAVATNALAVAYGDFKQAYQIVDRMGVRVLRDPYTNKPFVRFYTTKRVGGAVVNYESFAIGKISVS